MQEVIVIDIGGTKTNISFVNENEKSLIRVLSSETFKTLSNPEHTIQKIISVCDMKGFKSDYLSLSLPGKWENGILKESCFLKGWIDYPFITQLQNELKIKDVIWESDVICGALGEYNFGVETCRGMSLLYINLGTGIGAAFIKDGKPLRACHGKPLLRLQKLVFSCDEEIYSGVDLISGGSLLENSHCESIEALFKNYKNADVEAIDLISRAQYQLAAWIINLFYLFAPDVIILNGGLTYDWEVLAGDAVDLTNEELKDQVKIIPSRLKEMAPIYGAYVNAKPKLLPLTQEYIS